MRSESNPFYNNGISCDHELPSVSKLVFVIDGRKEEFSVDTWLKTNWTYKGMELTDSQKRELLQMLKLSAANR